MSLNAVFPHLAEEGFRETSPATSRYNCIAWDGTSTGVSRRVAEIAEEGQLQVDLRQTVGLAIGLAEHGVGFIAVEEASGIGLEVEAAAGAEGDLAEMD